MVFARGSAGAGCESAAASAVSAQQGEGESLPAWFERSPWQNSLGGKTWKYFLVVGYCVLDLFAAVGR
jgi:hypothetical protein